MIVENFLDEDVAYLLGLIVMRGQLYDRGPERGIIIEFPFKSLQVEGYDQELHLQLRPCRSITFRFCAHADAARSCSSSAARRGAVSS